ncbi:MAG TPA: hypothetical protein VGP46_04235 [Acidimicrobiales bacterium]|nr:hypothetical protein [Acidimicrobiales bacterium]
MKEADEMAVAGGLDRLEGIRAVDAQLAAGTTGVKAPAAATGAGSPDKRAGERRVLKARNGSIPRALRKLRILN